MHPAEGSFRKQVKPTGKEKFFLTIERVWNTPATFTVSKDSHKIFRYVIAKVRGSQRGLVHALISSCTDRLIRITVGMHNGSDAAA